MGRQEDHSEACHGREPCNRPAQLQLPCSLSHQARATLRITPTSSSRSTWRGGWRAPSSPPSPPPSSSSSSPTSHSTFHMRPWSSASPSTCSCSLTCEALTHMYQNYKSPTKQVNPDRLQQIADASNQLLHPPRRRADCQPQPCRPHPPRCHLLCSECLFHQLLSPNTPFLVFTQNIMPLFSVLETEGAPCLGRVARAGEDIIFIFPNN